MVMSSALRRNLPLLGGLVLAALLSLVLLKRYEASEVVWLCIGAVIGLSGVWLAVARKEIVYVLLIAALPLEATFVIEAGFSITPYYIMFGLLLLSYLIHNQRLRFDDMPTRIFLAYLAVCAASLVSGLFVEPPAVHASSAMEWRASAIRPLIQLMLAAVHILFFVTVLNFANSRENIMRSLRVYLVVGLALGLLGCWQTLAVALDLPGKDFTQAFGAAASQGYKYGQTRFYAAFISNFAPRATFRESLHFSHFLVSFLPLALGLVIYRKQLPENWRIKTPVILVVLSFLALFLTMSRSGWLAFACSVIYMFACFPKGRMFKIAIVTIAALGCAGLLLKSLGYFRFDLDLWQLMQLRMDVDALEADPRVLYMQALWSTFAQYPILGVGIGNYGIFGAAQLGTDLILSAHSIFLNALAETGLIGFLVLAGVIVHYFVTSTRAILQARGYAPFPLLVGVSAGIFGMTLQYCTFGDRPGFHYLFMLAIGYALIRYVRQNRPACLDPVS